jgi:serine/threonine protein kinase
MTNLIGKSLGRYHILEQLGEGGMAVVYKAYDTRLETDVAVKVIRTENILPSVLERALKRFEREAKSLAKLTHPNIVKVMDYGDYEGKPYLVLPYLPGGTLKKKLGKPIPWQEAVEMLLPIAEALDYAHSQKMVHRDVKPANILLTERGQPMLTDFGIAKVLDIEETMDLTGTSAAVGTPEYMAPEQATAKTADHRADIYALGIVLYEMITGRKPYTADTPMAVLIMHARDPLPRPSKFISGIPNAVEKVLIKALAKSPDNRYQSMAEMVTALERLFGGKRRESAWVSVSQGKEKKPSSDKKETQPNRKGLLSLGVIGIAIVALIAIMGLFSKSTVFSNIFASATPTLTFTPTSTATPLFTPTPILTATPTASATFTPTLTPTNEAPFIPNNSDFDIWNVQITQLSKSKIRVDFEYKIDKSLNLADYRFTATVDCKISFVPYAPHNYEGNTKDDSEGTKIYLKDSPEGCHSNFLNVSLDKKVEVTESGYSLETIYSEEFEISVILSE